MPRITPRQCSGPATRRTRAGRRRTHRTAASSSGSRAATHRSQLRRSHRDHTARLTSSRHRRYLGTRTIMAPINNAPQGTPEWFSHCKTKCPRCTGAREQRKARITERNSQTGHHWKDAEQSWTCLACNSDVHVHDATSLIRHFTVRHADGPPAVIGDDDSQPKLRHINLSKVAKTSTNRPIWSHWHACCRVIQFVAMAPFEK